MQISSFISRSLRIRHTCHGEGESSASNFRKPYLFTMKNLLQRILPISPLAALALTGQSSADSSFHSSRNKAWGANIGAIAFDSTITNGVKVYESHLEGYAWSANTGWIRFGADLGPDNSYSYTNVNGSDFGVNHDGAGNLTGYAWSANLGWINFGWASTTDNKRPQINLVDGTLTGFAWSANAGWINFNYETITVDSIDTEADWDADGIPNWWEFKHFGTATGADASEDTDGDGATELEEYYAGTDPNDADDYLTITEHSYDSSYTEATITFSSNSTRLYSLELSEDLDTWTDSGYGEFLADSGGSTTKTVTFTTGEKMFFRAKTSLPLVP